MSSILKVDQLQDSGGNNIITSNGSGTFTSSLPNTGITMADQWRLNTGTTFTTSGLDITANLERVDTAGQGFIGTGMTESSGIFSFPQTGIYQVDAHFSVYSSTATRWVYGIIKGTTDNSTYNNLAGSYQNIAIASSGGNYAVINSSTLFDVTDISNDKIKFHLDTQAATINLYASTNINITFFTFKRLGDT